MSIKVALLVLGLLYCAGMRGIVKGVGRKPKVIEIVGTEHYYEMDASAWEPEEVYIPLGEDFEFFYLWQG
ncbi:MAG: hypothetical protein U9Q76_07485, partial [candidate division WOR-3 bacterium]|nr:hypothetical protein [candidate division WOR-3 bacterium]